MPGFLGIIHRDIVLYNLSSHLDLSISICTTLRLMASQNWWFGDPKDPCYTHPNPSFLEGPVILRVNSFIPTSQPKVTTTLLAPGFLGPIPMPDRQVSSASSHLSFVYCLPEF